MTDLRQDLDSRRDIAVAHYCDLIVRRAEEARKQSTRSGERANNASPSDK